MRKRILVSAAGTATAFHLAELIHKQFGRYFEVFLCDTNPRHLVAAASLAKAFCTVPPAADPAFRRTMLRIFAEQDTNIYVPLVDRDAYTFPCDDPKLRDLGVLSVAPPGKSARILRDKRVLANFLATCGFAVPLKFSASEVRACPDAQYFVKPWEGFGSRGASIMTGRQIIERVEAENDFDCLIQEVCHPPEITVEVYNSSGTVRSICRERLEVKSGVCTKARVFRDVVLASLAESLSRKLDLPVGFCFQVMRNVQGKWVITDLNPRLGAGTALSSVCGWSLASAVLVKWGGLPKDPLSYLGDFEGDRFAVRAFRDLRTL